MGGIDEQFRWFMNVEQDFEAMISNRIGSSMLTKNLEAVAIGNDC